MWKQPKGVAPKGVVHFWVLVHTTVHIKGCDLSNLPLLLPLPSNAALHNPWTFRQGIAPACPCHYERSRAIRLSIWTCYDSFLYFRDVPSFLNHVFFRSNAISGWSPNNIGTIPVSKSKSGESPISKIQIGMIPIFKNQNRDRPHFQKSKSGSSPFSQGVGYGQPMNQGLPNTQFWITPLRITPLDRFQLVFAWQFV